MAQQALQQQVADTEIKAEFYTPTIVRVTKTPVGRNYTPKNLVVTAKPRQELHSKEPGCHGKAAGCDGQPQG